MFLLDTNVISETNRSRPAAHVLAWIDGVPQEMHFSAVSLAEITRGATRHPDPVQRDRLHAWIEHGLRNWPGAGVLPISKEIAEGAGHLAGLRDGAGRPISVADSSIAATAIDYQFILATRNTKDFVGLPLRLLNPWTDSGAEQAAPL